MTPHVILNAITDDVMGWKCYAGKNYTKAERLVHELHQGFIYPENPNLVRWTPPFVSPMSFVKVFEYVKGARIEGKTIFEGGSLTSYLVLTRKKQAKAPFDSSPLDQRLSKDWWT